MGHLIIGEFMATRSECSEVRYIVSPQNPLKAPAQLAHEDQRLDMTRLGVRGNPLLSADPVEFALPRPSYTIDTLNHLAKRHPHNAYRLIIGSDNLAIFREWKNWKEILDVYGCLVYLRPGYSPGRLAGHSGVQILEAPLLDISATYIRERLAAGTSVRYLVPENVRRYIARNNMYGSLS